MFSKLGKWLFGEKKQHELYAISRDAIWKHKHNYLSLYVLVEYSNKQIWHYKLGDIVIGAKGKITAEGFAEDVYKILKLSDRDLSKSDELIDIMYELEAEAIRLWLRDYASTELLRAKKFDR